MVVDFHVLKNLQQAGLADINSLKGPEEIVLQNYCYLLARDILEIGLQHKKKVNDLVINAVKCGIALGTKLQVKDGEVTGRD